MMQESCSWLVRIQQKKNCPKQMDQVQDISNPKGEGSMLIYLPTARLNVKALSNSFNQENALVEAFSDCEN